MIKSIILLLLAFLTVACQPQAATYIKNPIKPITPAPLKADIAVYGYTVH